MKTEFYNKTKRQSIYSSVFIYKIISLCILAVLTCIMAVLFHKYKTMYHEYTGEATPVLFLFMAVCLVIFIISIFLDIYILKKTVSIGQRLSKLAYIDKLTGLPNRYSCDLLLDSFSDPSTLEKTGFLLLRLNNLVTINADNGHDNGNHLISAFANILEETATDYGYAGRNGGNGRRQGSWRCASPRSLFWRELSQPFFCPAGIKRPLPETAVTRSAGS